MSKSTKAHYSNIYKNHWLYICNKLINIFIVNIKDFDIISTYAENVHRYFPQMHDSSWFNFYALHKKYLDLSINFVLKGTYRLIQDNGPLEVFVAVVLIFFRKFTPCIIESVKNLILPVIPKVNFVIFKSSKPIIFSGTSRIFLCHITLLYTYLS